MAFIKRLWSTARRKPHAVKFPQGRNWQGSATE